MASVLDSIIRRVVGVGIVAAIVTALWLLYLERAPVERAVESDIRGGAAPAAPSAAPPAPPAVPAPGNAAPAPVNTAPAAVTPPAGGTTTPPAAPAVPAPGHAAPTPVNTAPAAVTPPAGGTTTPPVRVPQAPAKAAPAPAAAPPSGAIVPAAPKPLASGSASTPPAAPDASRDAAPATPPADGAIEPAAPRSAADLAASLWGVNQPARIGRAPPPPAHAVTPPSAPLPPAFGKGARDVYAMMVAARRAAWEGHPDEAIARYRAVIRIQPHHYNAWGEMGNVLYGERRFAEAARAYERTADLLIDAGNPWYAARLLPVLQALAPAAAARLDARLRAPPGGTPH